MTSVYLHGFLGLPEDWKQLVTSDATCISIWKSMQEIQGEIGFSSWADYFLQTTPRGIRAYGYSLGGRLLLHAFQKKPEHFSSLHLFATNYGLSVESEKRARLVNDQKWASRFKNEDWFTLMRDWNQQAVFKGSIEPERKENDFNRELLATALDAFSLGRQENLLSVIQNSEVPLRYVVGAKDERFVTLSHAIAPTGYVSIEVIEGVGHRLLWEPSINAKLR